MQQRHHTRRYPTRAGTAAVWQPGPHCGGHQSAKVAGDTIATAEGPMFDGSPAHRDLELRHWSHTA